MYTALLLHFDGPEGSTTFADATGRHTGAANGAAQIDTAFSQWGNASLAVDGNSGSYASFTGNLSDFNLPGDFTIEFTVRPVSYGASGFICFHSDPSLVLTNRYWIQVDAAGIAHWAINGAFVIDSTDTVPLNTETHIAVSRVGSSTQLFIGGVSQGTFVGTDNLAIGTAFIIGARGDGTAFVLNGNIDEFRVVKDYGVYTANFQIPAGPFSLDVTQLRPPFYFIYRPIDTLQRSWTWSYNLLLIGKDQLPIGEQTYDLTPKPYEFSPLFRTWQWNYNLNLISKDALVTGEQVFDLPSKGYEYPSSLRTWISYYPLTAIQVQAPFSQDDWPLPSRYTPIQQSWAFSLLLSTLLPLPPGKLFYDLAPRAYSEPATRTWAWNYNLNLIAQDAMVTGEQVYDLAPRAYPEPATRTWLWSYNLNLIARDRLAIGKQSYDLTPIAQSQILPRSWTWNFNLNLLGQDQLPTGEQVSDLPPVGPFYATQLRTWIYFTPPTAPFQFPFNQSDWPVNLGPALPQRSYTYSYNLNLVSQDRMATGEQVYDLPPRPYPEPATRTWAFAFNLTLIGKDRMLTGKQVYDLTPIAQPQILPRSWTWNYNLNLIAQDQFPTGEQRFDLPPFGPAYSVQLRSWIYFNPPVTGVPFNQSDWPVNLGPQLPQRSWNFSFNLNLISKDQLPIGEQVYNLAPVGYIYPAQLRTWFDRFDLPLFAATLIPPPNQFDWPNPKAPLQPDRFYTFSSLRLRGRDAMVVGDQLYDLPPRPYAEPATRTWIWNFVQATRVQPIGGRSYDLAPRDDRPIQLRSYTFSLNPNLISKDRLPVGEQIWELTPRDHQRLPQLRVWYENFSIARLNIALPIGIQVYDRPPLRGPLLPTQVWITGLNPRLIGKDVLPAGKQFYELPRGPITPRDILSWISSANNALTAIPPDRTHVIRPFDWAYQAEWAQDYPYPASLRSFVSGQNLCIGMPSTPIPPIPPTPPVGPQFVHNPGNEWQIYDRIREPGPVGWR